MAAKGLVGEFCSETTCPICLEYFKDPVTVDCGHNFCQICLTRHWTESDKNSCCPHCRQKIQQRSYRPNQQLANLVELVKKLQEGSNKECKSGVCERHQEPLKLFCNDDQVSICVVCDRSEEHRNHSVYPMEEASREYKGKIEVFLETLKKTLENLLAWKTSEELGREERLKQVEIENEKVSCAFEGMQQFLEEKRHFWLAQLKEMEKEIEKRREEDITKFSEKLSQLSQLISEMEEKCRQPASEFLQDIKNALSRYGEHLAQYELDLCPNTEERCRIMSLKKSVLQKAVESYKETLEQVLNPSKLEQALKADSLMQVVNKVNVILDVHTAHPHLTVSEDMKNVKLGSKKKSEWWKKNMLDSPMRFEWDPCVLGYEKLIAGVHWWLVEVSGVGSWAVGVTVDVVRKGSTRLNPNEGIWAVGKPYCDTFSPYDILALTFPEPTPLRLSKDLKKILLVLDYEEGRVDFFDADSNGLIFTFHTETFCGESIRPFFQVRECGLSLTC
ncbi:zinc finger protein RFP-like [Elgaria multicarinata webbii]|uniref:zinc finger protein RFP-like n=1 Tax=Elgaria multicarinata webbii TaxID=159646 RepID=UPI002FCD2B3F